MRGVVGFLAGMLVACGPGSDGSDGVAGHDGSNGNDGAAADDIGCDSDFDCDTFDFCFVAECRPALDTQWFIEIQTVQMSRPVFSP